jgi:hypothetical protein
MICTNLVGKVVQCQGALHPPPLVAGCHHRPGRSTLLLNGLCGYGNSGRSLRCLGQALADLRQDFGAAVALGCVLLDKFAVDLIDYAKHLALRGDPVGLNLTVGLTPCQPALCKPKFDLITSDRYI